MTSKVRIILGFSILTLMILLLSGMSYMSSQEFSKNLQSFDKLYKADSLTYQAETHIFRLAYHYELFMEGRTREDKDFVLQEAQALSRVNENLLTLLSTQDTQSVRATLGTLKRFSQLLERNMNNNGQVYQIFTTRLAPAKDSVLKTLKVLTDMAQSMHDINLMRDALQSQYDVMLFSENMVSFVMSQNKTFLEAARKEQSIAEKSVQTLLTRKTQEAFSNTAILNELEAAFASLTQAGDQLETLAGGIVKDDAEITQLRESILKDTTNISSKISQYAESTFSLLTKNTEDSVETNVILSAVAIAISLLLAAIIVTILTKTLRTLADYAQHISRGNFAYDPKITEKGEIGLIATGLKDITVVLLRLIKHCRNTTNKISTGDLTARMDAQRFEGEFQNIASVTNVMAETYTKHLDNLPVGILAGTSENTIIFMNKTAKMMIGEDNVVGSKCGQMFNSPACPDPSLCLGRRALSQGVGNVSGDATCFPKTGKKELSVFACPLYDLDNKPVNYMEIFTDITKITEQSQAIQDISAQASDVANRVSSAAEELSVQTDSIVHSSQVQRERIESTSAAMTEMNASVVEVAHNALSTSEQSDLVRHKANDGIKIIANMSASMEALLSSSENLQSNMSQLDKLAEGIDSIINVISDIADQTNLLALNAAIEAARAGEAGRGFAVVADEVRKLAEKTMSATQEVDTSIRSIQHSSRANQQEVGSVTNNIAQAAKLAKQSEQSLREIVDVTTQTSEMIQTIASAAEQQTSASNEIAHSMNDINATVNSTSDAILQSAEAIRELTAQAHELHEIISKVQ